MSKAPTPNTRILKLDPETHERVNELAAWLGIDASQLVGDAVAAYLRSHREDMEKRIQDRILHLFEKVDKRLDAEPSTGWDSDYSTWGTRDDCA